MPAHPPLELHTVSTETEVEADPKTGTRQAEAELSELFAKASPLVSRMLGREVTVSPVRPAGQPYVYRIDLEGADGSLCRLPGNYSAAAVRSAVEVIVALGALPR